MVATTKNPICDFRALNVAAAGVKATATTTAPGAASYPPNNNNIPYLVVQDIAACLVSGTANQGVLRVNLIDGSSGGSNILWSGLVGGGTNAASNLVASYLNIPCYSGLATLEFSAAGGTLATQSVAFGGYYGGGMGGQ